MKKASTESHPKRVLYVDNDYGNIGGSRRSLFLLVKYLDRTKYEPFVTFATNSPNPMVADFKRLGCHIVEFGPKPCPPSERAAVSSDNAWKKRIPLSVRKTLWYTQTALAKFYQALELKKIIERYHIDLIHANDRIGSNWHAIWAGALARVPVVCHERLIYRFSPIDTLTARWVDISICNTESVRQSVVSQINSKNTVVIPVGVEIPEVTPMFKPLGPSPRVALITRIERWKGLHLFIRAAHQLKPAFPNARFLIFGEPTSPDGRSYYQESQALVTELQLEGYVSFMGFVKEIERALADQVDVVVHTPTIPDPCGRAIIEGMTMGIPAIGPRGSGCSDIIEDGVSGLLFELNNADSLVEALSTLLSRPELAKNLARGGWRRVEHWDTRNSAARVQAVYDDLMSLQQSG